MPKSDGSPATEAPLEGLIAGRYRIERQIGRGGMAEVHLATDTKLERLVALKVLPQSSQSDLDRDRFLREIRVTSRLSHTNILPLLDSGEHGRILFFVAPYVPGETLRDRLAREGRLLPAEALRLTREVAHALDYAHESGVVHRDIKPDNILLLEGHAVVADFGIALARLSPASETWLTDAGAAIGTPAYMSPEHLLGRDIDGRADYFGLGCVLYECLTGHRPFDGLHVSARLTSRPSLWRHLPKVSDDLERLVGALLEVEPTRRCGSVQEIDACLGGAVSAGRHQAIVVLPFTNLSPEATNDYLSDGVTEEITADLSRVGALRVIARHSALQFKARHVAPREIGRLLGVGFVLEGSVRRAGTQIKITARLMDATTDLQVWAQTFGGSLDNVFDLQERVARDVVAALDVTISAEENLQLAVRPLKRGRSFELFVEARQEIRRWGDGPARALDILARAMEVEGRTPDLRALVGLAYVAQVKAGMNRGDDLLARAEHEAIALFATRPDSPSGHALLGFIEYERGRQAEAIRHFEIALRKEPSDADVLFYLGISCIHADRLDDADRASRQLLSCDPLAPMAWLLGGVVLWFRGHFSASLPSFKRGLELDPGHYMLHWALGYALAALGRLDEARLEVQVLLRIGQAVPYTAQLAALVDGLLGRPIDARVWLEGLDLGHLDAHLTFHMAESWAACDVDRAMELLEDAVAGGFAPTAFLERDCPFLAPLRPQAAFQRLLQRSKRSKTAV